MADDEADEWIEFGQEPEPLDLPPPPVRGKAKEEPPKGSPPPAELVDMGDPPSDVLGLRAYTMRALAILMRRAMLDPGLDDKARTKQVMQLARAIEALKADSEVWEALEEMRRDRAELERPNRGATFEPAPADGSHALPH